MTDIITASAIVGLITTVIITVFVISITKERFGSTKIPQENSISYETYVISLDSKIFESAKEHLKINDAKMFDAIKGNSITQQQLKDRSFISTRAFFDLNNSHRDSHAGLTNLNAIGCYMSHVTLWKKLVESNNDGMLIFESDASCFSGVDTDALIQSFKKINNAHLLLFGTLMSGLFSGTTFTKLTNKFYGTHSYYITKKGAQTFLKYAFPIEQQIDSFMADIMMLSHLKNSIIDKIDAYVINVCNQRNNGTSIQTKQVKC